MVPLIQITVHQAVWKAVTFCFWNLQLQIKKEKGKKWGGKYNKIASYFAQRQLFTHSMHPPTTRSLCKLSYLPWTLIHSPSTSTIPSELLKLHIEFNHHLQGKHHLISLTRSNHTHTKYVYIPHTARLIHNCNFTLYLC